MHQTGRSILIAVRLMIVFIVVLGIAYPLLITGIGQAFFHSKANGSLLQDRNGQTVGSALLGQSFSDAQGNPLPQYFQPRPSAVNYDGSDSGGSNQGPENPALIADITQRKAQIAAFNGVPESEVPPDAVTASGSGLDPDISPAYAAIQVNRVAKARGLSVDQVQALVAKYTTGPDLGFIGESRVNVVQLNLALDELR
ncbi:MAG: potassium-transporting ATPase subunit KdpC [Propionibacteriaceae bacterium]|nr:potassium-transporting ATPase subunit KdpC [Propionibacteriaceae bacterium]